ncbi:hypothetical protein T265_15861, partial [Opisthorchis viverrini]
MSLITIDRSLFAHSSVSSSSSASYCQDSDKAANVQDALENSSKSRLYVCKPNILDLIDTDTVVSFPQM